MTKTELQDNLVFLSALKLLEQLTEKGLLTVDEAEKSRIELERKLRPTGWHCCGRSWSWNRRTKKPCGNFLSRQ